LPNIETNGAEKTQKGAAAPQLLCWIYENAPPAHLPDDRGNITQLSKY
jgi:hypothetical protein